MISNLQIKIDTGTKELLSHGKNYIISSIIVKGLAVISIAIFTRLMTTDEYGILSVFSSIVPIFSIIFFAGFDTSISRYYYEKNNDFNRFFSSNLFFVHIIGGLLFLIIIINKDFLAEFVAVPQVVVVLAAAIALFSLTFDAMNAYLKAAQKSLLVSKLSVVKSSFVITIAVCVTLLLDKNRFLGSMYSQLFFSFIFFIYAIYFLKNNIVFDFSFSYIKYSILYGLPVVAHALARIILNTFDQVMINKMVGSSEAGIYAFAYKIGMLLLIVTVALNQAWVPQFFEKLKNGEFKQIRLIVTKYSIIVSVFASILVFFAPFLVKIFAPEEYASALPLVPVIIIGFLFHFMYVFYVNYAFYEKKTVLIAIFTIIAGIVNLGLNYYLIPRYGYTVAAWTTVISYFILFLLHFININYVIKMKNVVPLRIIGFPIAIAVVLIMLRIMI